MSESDSDPIAEERGGPMWRLGRAIVWARLFVVAAWIAGAVFATSQLPSGLGSEAAELGSLLPRSSKAVEVEEDSIRTFGFPLISRSMVVAHKEGGFDAGDTAAALRYVARTDRGGSGLKAVPFAAEGRPLAGGTIGDTFLVYLYDREEGEAVSASEGFATGLRRATGADTAHVTGALPAAAAESNLVEEHLLWVEIATVVLVVGILAIYFRSAGIPLLCLAGVGLAYLVSDRLLGLVAEEFGLAIPEEVQPVIIALLFGVLTDYLVFFVSGFRARLRRGASSVEAASAVTAELLPVVATAALMIAGATMTLSLSGVDFLSAFGPAMAIAVLVGALVSLTFLPACLAIFGRVVFWPHRIDVVDADGADEDEEAPRARGRIVGFAARHPVPVIVACLVLLLAAASGLRELELGNPIIRGLPTTTQSRQGYDEATQALGPGVVGPSMLVIEGEGVGTDAAALTSLQEGIEAQPGIASVTGPAHRLAQLPPGIFVSEDGGAARFLVVLDADPDGPTAPGILSGLEARLPTMLERSGLEGTSFGVTGDTSINHELTEDTWHAGLKVAPAAIAVLLLLLFALLRSRSAPIYLVASSLLVVAAALGLTVYVFQGLLGYNEIAFFVPVATAILMLALGADYNVFLVSRIWRETERRDAQDAIRTAGSRASSAIGVAGLILALSFAAVWLIPIAAFRELAFAMFVGLMLDTWLARPLLVPALVSLFGARSARDP
ncbi:MAG TPA: MMPL family transporter [Solirubrobacterales bacterium]|jgi:RND superfamily putative drug exporter|nr:MMPL family transporter [Solirubrobacterales bacterium]